MSTPKSTPDLATLTPARAYLACVYACYATGEWDGDQSPNDLIAEIENVPSAELDADGDVWLDRDGGGNWVSPDGLASLAARLLDRGI